MHVHPRSVAGPKDGPSHYVSPSGLDSSAYLQNEMFVVCVDAVSDLTCTAGSMQCSLPQACASSFLMQYAYNALLLGPRVESVAGLP